MAAAPVIAPANPSIISLIVSGLEKGAVTLWNDAESIINADVARVEAVLPASAKPLFAASVSIVKQGASDALTMGAGLVAAGAPAAIASVEAAADALLAAYTGPVAPVLTLGANDLIDGVAAPLIAAVNAWVLKQKAAAAEAVAPK